MNQEVYITDKERIKCKKVGAAFAELCRDEDIIILDAGRYGFVLLRDYNRCTKRFEGIDTFVDSKQMFERLWDEWYLFKLVHLSEGTQLEGMDYDKLFIRLPRETQEVIMGMKSFFAGRAGVED